MSPVRRSRGSKKEGTYLCCTALGLESRSSKSNHELSAFWTWNTSKPVILPRQMGQRSLRVTDRTCRVEAQSSHMHKCLHGRTAVFRGSVRQITQGSPTADS